MIPKIAHVVWVGPNPMPDRYRTMLKANRAALEAQGFALRLWDTPAATSLAAQYPAIRSFMDEASAAKRWAFVSDAIKMMALVQYGGWVLDADNEVLGDLNQFAGHGWVSGWERWGGNLHPITAAMGAVKAHPFSVDLLSAYATVRPEVLYTEPNTQWISRGLWANGMNRTGARQYLPSLDVEIYPAEVFCGQPDVTPDTVIRHHFAGSWL